MTYNSYKVTILPFKENDNLQFKQLNIYYFSRYIYENRQKI